MHIMHFALSTDVHKTYCYNYNKKVYGSDGKHDMWPPCNFKVVYNCCMLTSTIHYVIQLISVA